MARRCNKCLRGARVGTTGAGTARGRTLKMDMGGAVLYVIPKSDGTIDVYLNSEKLLEGDFAYANWDGKKWSYATDNPKNTAR